VASSGGNAGMAAAYVARHMNVPLTLYVPMATGNDVKDKLIAQVRTHWAYFYERIESTLPNGSQWRSQGAGGAALPLAPVPKNTAPLVSFLF